MESSDAFLRVKILQVTQLPTYANDPQLAVDIKEAGAGQKKSFFPEWGKCFDSHLTEGRRMHVIVKDKLPGQPVEAAEKVAELTVLLDSIAQQCQLGGSGVSKMSVSDSHCDIDRTTCSDCSDCMHLASSCRRWSSWVARVSMMDYIFGSDYKT